MNKTFDLYVYDGDYGLPSFDVECIKSILYVKVAKVPASVKLVNNIKSCCSHSGPSLLATNTVFSGFTAISKHLRQLHFNPDCGLTSREASDCYAVHSLVTTKLDPVLRYLQWIDVRNCDEFTTLWYMKALPFPFNYSRIKQCKSLAVETMEVLYPNENLDCLREIMKTLASNTLSALSTRLGHSQYFFGDTPTTLDAIIYAYVAPLVKIPFPSNEISSLITMWPNLVNFVKRIDSKYFPGVSSDAKYLKKIEKVKQNEDDVSYLALFLLITSASTIMFCFAMNKGIVKLPSS